MPGLALNGDHDRRLPNTLNVSFPNADGEDLLARAQAVAASTGSACHAGAVRLSLGYSTTEADVDTAAGALTATATAAATHS